MKISKFIDQVSFRKFAWIFLVFVPYVLIAQGKTDSLKQVLATEPNAQRKAQLCNELAMEIKAKDLESSVGYALKAREIAMQGGFTKEQGVAQSILGLLISYTDFIDSAIQWNKSAIPLLLPSGDSLEISRNFNRLGADYLLINNFKEAEKYIKQAISWTDSPKIKSGAYNNLGMISKKNGDYAMAMGYYINALKNYELLNEPVSKARTLNNLGSLYIQKKDYKMAGVVYHEANEISNLTGDPEGLGLSLAGLGMVTDHLGKHSEALLYSSKAAEIFKANRMYGDYAKQMISVGDLQNEAKHYKLAEKSYFEAEAILKAQNDQFGLSALYNNIADCYIKQNQPKKAITYLEKSYELSKTYKDVNYNRLIVKNLSTTYESLGQTEKALKYRKLYEELNDEMVNVAENVKYAELSQAFETSKKEKKIEQQHAQITELQTSFTYIYVLVVSLVMVVLLIVILYRRRVLNHRRLEESITSIAKQIASLKNENTELKVKLQETELELNGLAVKYVESKERLPEHLISLSKREYEVLLFIAEGLTDKEIAEKIFVSVNTVRTHIRRIYDKLFVKSRVEAVALLNKYQLLSEGS